MYAMPKWIYTLFSRTQCKVIEVRPSILAGIYTLFSRTQCKFLEVLAGSQFETYNLTRWGPVTIQVLAGSHFETNNLTLWGPCNFMQTARHRRNNASTQHKAT